MTKAFACGGACCHRLRLLYKDANPPVYSDLYGPRPLDDIVREIRAFPELPLARQIDYVRGLVQTSPVFSADWGGTWCYRRVRQIGPDDVIATVQDLIWHPTRPARAGRANLPGVPMFYAGDRPDTALREARVEDHQVIMTTFQVQPDHRFHLATVGELARLVRTGRGYLILGTEEAAKLLSRFVNAGDPDRARAAMIVDSFLLQCMSDPREDYELSANVVNAVFQKLPTLSAFAYPSVRQLGCVNIAVRTEGFWDTWSVQTVRQGHASYLEQGFYRFVDQRHVCAIDPQGRLTWSEPSNQPHGFVPSWHLGRTSTMEEMAARERKNAFEE